MHLSWQSLGSYGRTDEYIFMKRIEYAGRHGHPHDHDFYEFGLVADGAGWHESIYGRQELVRGDAFFISPGTWHAYSPCDRLVVDNVAFPPEFAEAELRWVIEDPAIRALLRPSDGGGIV